jgi:putative hemolysin
VTATALVVTIITFITIVFGRRCQNSFYRATARLISRPMKWVAGIVLMRLLSIESRGYSCCASTADRPRAVTEELPPAWKRGVDAEAEEHEHQMVAKRLCWTTAAFHVADAAALPTSSGWTLPTIEQAIARRGNTGHSWYPVVRGNPGR